MNQTKRVLLIAGGGTLGTYTGEELLRKGCYVDVICPEDKVSHHERLRFIQSRASLELLEELFSQNRYDGIVNFLHYSDPEKYPPYHALLTANTDHLIFLSSYRVYADQQPITEETPMLLDVTEDLEFRETERYAISKAKMERFLRAQEGPVNWTIVRPVISSSYRRLDIVTISKNTVLEMTREGKTISLPLAAKDKTAGLDWAGNSGKLIANLLFKEETKGQAYTISSAQNLTWGQVAEIYTELVGAKFQWVDTETYIQEFETEATPWGLFYDRLFDRVIDNSKVLRATGLKPEDFLSLKEGIQQEIMYLEGKNESDSRKC